MQGVRGANFSTLGEELIIEEILSRLPSSSLASTARVNHSWHRMTRAVLLRPYLVSAISDNISARDGIREAIDSILKRPFRPQFIIAYVSKRDHMRVVAGPIRRTFGFNTPSIIFVADGIIGNHGNTGNFMEVNWLESDNPLGENNREASLGICLIAGHFPGLLVEAIPYNKSDEEFVEEIKEYSRAASDSTSPAAIMMFGRYGMAPILQKMDCAIPLQTVFFGGQVGHFIHKRKGDRMFNYNFLIGYVALVFAQDKDKPQDLGDVQFHVALSTSMVPVGPTYRVSHVETWLSRTFPSAENQFGLAVTADNFMENIQPRDKYIGVAKARQCSSESVPKKILDFYEIVGPNGPYVQVYDVGIRVEDTFRVYRSSPDVGRASYDQVADTFARMKRDTGRYIFGGLISSSGYLNETFFGTEHVISRPFSQHFPGIPLAGLMCWGQVARCGEGTEADDPLKFVHGYSTAYLVLSYR